MTSASREDRGHFDTRMRFARRIHGVEEGPEHLRAKLGEHFEQRTALHLVELPSPDLADTLVGQVHHEVRPSQNRDEHGRLHE